MILIDIEVPVMSKKYNFQVDETALIGDVLIQIKDMICLQEQCIITGNPEELMLWDKGKKMQLSLEGALGDYEIKTGSRLLLV